MKIDDIIHSNTETKLKMKLCMLFGTYVKRCSNLMLIAADNRTASSKELHLAISESIDCLKALGVDCELVNGGLRDIPSVMLVDIVLTIGAVFDIVSCLRRRARELTLMSVKECMDELPVGICFYRDGGLTKLTNLKMESIAQRLTGSNISDAESFREAVSKSEEAPVLSFEDGTTYSFVHRTELLGGKTINELIAFDVTEEYSLTQELREKQRRARIINTRLKALNSTIQYIIMDKETLRIKMHIHDSLGKMLLMTRRYLAEPEKTDLKEILSLWGRNISMLKNEEPEDWQEPHFVSFHHAEAMGIEIKLKGGLPEDAVAICLEEKIDLVMIDVVMGSDMDGIDAAKRIKEKCPGTKIMVVTSMPEVSYIDRAKKIGVEIFWHKEVQEQPLIEIMDRTMAGESIYPLSMPAVKFGNSVSTELTDIELEVLRELVAGASNKEIGERLYMSASTVKRHISDMLAKTGFKSRLQLAIRARGGGLIINNRDINGEE